MTDLPEDADERRMFNSNIQTFGGPLQAVAASLTLWSQAMPQEGSLAKMCAIMANEVGRAIEALKEPPEPNFPTLLNGRVDIEAMNKANCPDVEHGGREEDCQDSDEGA